MAASFVAALELVRLKEKVLNVNVILDTKETHVDKVMRMGYYVIVERERERERESCREKNIERERKGGRV